MIAWVKRLWLRRVGASCVITAEMLDAAIENRKDHNLPHTHGCLVSVAAAQAFGEPVAWGYGSGYLRRDGATIVSTDTEAARALVRRFDFKDYDGLRELLPLRVSFKVQP